MNTQTAIRNLQIITALDSLTYGLIYGFINPYILSLGGSHVHAAILAIGSLLGDLLSPDVVKIFTHVHGKRYALFFILNTAIVTHLMMVLTCSYWFTILVRILFSITNQSQSLCHELLLSKTQNEDLKTILQRNYSILSGSGYILGPIISGYIFDSGFGYIGALSAFLTLVNICLLMKVTKDAEDINLEHMEKSVLEKACDSVIENVMEFKKCNLNKYWDILLMKYFFAGSALIFFSKFTLILKHNYHSSSIVIGYTASYINTVVFAATYYSAVVKSKVQKYPTIVASEASFLLITVLMLLACYSPYYEIYMLLLTPIIVLRTLMLTLWKDLFSERNNVSLMKLNNVASVIAGLTIPLLFGLLCNQIAHNAVILFSCIPMFLNWVITRCYSRFLTFDESDDTDNTQKKDS